MIADAILHQLKLIEITGRLKADPEKRGMNTNAFAGGAREGVLEHSNEIPELTHAAIGSRWTAVNAHVQSVSNG